MSCTNLSTKNVIQNADSLNVINSNIIASTKIVDGKYCLTYRVGDSLYLFEKHKLNQTLTIVDNNAGDLTESKTTGYIVYHDDAIGSIVLTRISPQPKSKKEINCIATFSSRPLDYKIEEQKNLLNEDLIKSSDSLIRSTEFLQELMKRNGDGNVQSDSLLEGVLPELVKVTANDFEYYIASYKIYDNSTIGPRLALMENKKVIPLTGQCSYEYFYTYFFNGKNYIQTGSSCCDCGIIGEQIFEVVKENIKPVFEDYSFSN
jgi:hypothetical protein